MQLIGLDIKIYWGAVVSISRTLPTYTPDIPKLSYAMLLYNNQLNHADLQDKQHAQCAQTHV